MRTLGGLIAKTNRERLMRFVFAGGIGCFHPAFAKTD
jgi:hypothetical protein